jgi:transposase
MDNLPVHQRVTVRELIEASGCRLLYVLPYSPDYSPIELVFSNIKTHLRRAAVRPSEALLDTIDSGLRTISSADACACFRHCGYHFPPTLDQ